MTKLIAHRGLTTGPDQELENKPHQIESALNQGYDAEVDVWYFVDTGFMLGHDEPLYPVSLEWLRQPGLWLHAKNLEALSLLRWENLNVFWHENDDHTMTAHKFIWTYPGITTCERNGVLVMPETAEIDFAALRHYKCYGICSDYVEKIKEALD